MFAVNVYASTSSLTVRVPLNGVPHPAMTTDCPAVNSWIPTVSKVATLLVSETI